MEAEEFDGEAVQAGWLEVLVTRMQANFKNRFQKPEVMTEADEQLLQWAEVIKGARGLADVDEFEGQLEVCWVDKAPFDLFFSGVAFLNAIFVGVEIDNVDDMDKPGVPYIVVHSLFIAFFMAELLILAFYKRLKWFHSVMNILNAVLTILAIIHVALLGNTVLLLVSLLRIVSLLRLMRIVKHVQFLQDLRLLLSGLVDSAQTILWVIALIVVCLYMAAVIVTKAIGKNAEVYGPYRKISGGWDHEEYFGTVSRSMGTLLQVMVLDSWSSDIARHVISKEWYWSIFFVFFILLSTHGLVNTVVSVVVEHTVTAVQIRESKRKVREEKSKKRDLLAIQTMFEKFDEDNNHELSIDEFRDNVQRVEVKRLLMELELPISDLAGLFCDLDGFRVLKMDEFIEGCANLKGPAQSRDILKLRSQANFIGTKLDNLGSNLATSEILMGKLDEVTTRISRRFTSAIAGSRQKIAESKGGSEPVVQPKRTRPGLQENVDLSIGNRPALPNLPNLLDT